MHSTWVWISRLLKRGWAEVIVAPWLSRVLGCRIWKPEGIEEVPKNVITHLWISVDVFVPPSVWGLSFLWAFLFYRVSTEHFSSSPFCFIPWAEGSLWGWPGSSPVQWGQNEISSVMNWAGLMLASSARWYQDHWTMGDGLQLASAFKSHSKD